VDYDTIWWIMTQFGGLWHNLVDYDTRLS